MKKNEVWIHAKTWKNLENMNERTETQRTTYYMIPFIQNVQNRQSFGDKVLSDFLGWSGQRRLHGEAGQTWHGPGERWHFYKE